MNYLPSDIVLAQNIICISQSSWNQEISVYEVKQNPFSCNPHHILLKIKFGMYSSSNTTLSSMSY